MKKVKFLSMLLIALMVGFTSCSKDDPEEPAFPGGGTETGAGTEASPYNIAAAIKNQGVANNTDYKYIKGYIVGIWETKDANGEDLYPNNFAKFEAPFYTNLNILLADSKDETNANNVVCVQLPFGDVRTALNLVDNPGRLKEEVTIAGTLERYNSMSGLKNATYYILSDGSTGGTKPGEGGDTGSGSGTETDPYDVNAAMSNQGKSAWVEGYIVGNVDGEGLSLSTESKFTAPFTIKTNILIAASAGETDYTKCVPVQLPAGAVREGLNVVDNESNLGKKVKLYGSLEAYFGAPGLRSSSYYELEGGTSGGTKPGDDSNAIFSETLLTQESFDKFTTYSVLGDQTWYFSTQGYGAVMSGYTDKSYANEDWLITPAIDMSGMTSATVSFDHARGPAGSINVGISEGYYTVWVSNDYNSGNPTETEWTELTGITHGTTAWGYVSSGNITIPTANLKANAKIAFRYLCTDDESATWEIRNIVVK